MLYLIHQPRADFDKGRAVSSQGVAGTRRLGGTEAGKSLNSFLLDRSFNLLKEVTVFKSHVRYIVKYGMGEEDEKFFKPSKVPNLRLRQMAVKNRVPCIRGLPKVAEDDAKRIATMILLTKGIKNAKLHLLFHCNVCNLNMAVHICI